MYSVQQIGNSRGLPRIMFGHGAFYDAKSGFFFHLFSYKSCCILTFTRRNRVSFFLFLIDILVCTCLQFRVCVVLALSISPIPSRTTPPSPYKHIDFRACHLLYTYQTYISRYSLCQVHQLIYQNVHIHIIPRLVNISILCDGIEWGLHVGWFRVLSFHSIGGL